MDHLEAHGLDMVSYLPELSLFVSSSPVPIFSKTEHWPIFTSSLEKGLAIRGQLWQLSLSPRILVPWFGHSWWTCLYLIAQSIVMMSFMIRSSFFKKMLRQCVTSSILPMKNLKWQDSTNLPYNAWNCGEWLYSKGIIHFSIIFFWQDQECHQCLSPHRQPFHQQAYAPSWTRPSAIRKFILMLMLTSWMTGNGLLQRDHRTLPKCQ